MNINIIGTIKQINMMKDNKARFQKYNNLIWTLSFLYQTNEITSDELDNFLSMLIDTDKMKKLFTKPKELSLHDIYSNTENLNKIYRHILLNIKNHDFKMQKYGIDDFDKILYYVEDFFRLLGNDVYKLYLNIIKHNLIVEKREHDKYASCGYINGELSSIILEMNIVPLYKAINLVHEVGHAYDNYLNKTQDYKRGFQINVEFTSMTFELLFLSYLKENNLISDRLQNVTFQNYYTDYLLRMNNAYIYNKLFLEHKLPTNLKLFNSQYFTQENLFNEGIIKNNLVKEYLEDISLYSNYYALGLLFSSYYLTKFQLNPKDTIKEIKDFSCLSNNFNTRDVINYYNIDELIKNTIKVTSKILKKAP